MCNLVTFALFALGLIMIIKGSDWLIDSVIWFSKVFRIPQIIIGATIVSICTTLPETFVSVTAATQGQTDFAIGNVVGSIAVNTGFVLGITAIFAKPFIENMTAFKKNGFLLLGLVIFLFVISITYGELNRLIGILLLLLLVAYLIENVISAKKAMKPSLNYEIESEEEMIDGLPVYEGVNLDVEEAELEISRKTIIKYSVFFVIGVGLVLLGSNLLVDNGILIAEIFNVSPIIIAITFTAFGTSLPELVTTITAIKKKATGIGVGNIIGASTMNIILSVALSSTVTAIPLNHDPNIIWILLPIAFAIVALAVFFGLFGKNGYHRWQGFVLIAAYIVFLILNLIMPV